FQFLQSLRDQIELVAGLLGLGRLLRRSLVEEISSSFLDFGYLIPLRIFQFLELLHDDLLAIFHFSLDRFLHILELADFGGTGGFSLRELSALIGLVDL